MVRRTLNRLTFRAVETKRKPGMYGDGGGLWLQVSPSTSRSWLFRFMLRGRAREMGLGSALNVSLAEARIKAADCRKLLDAGIDPIEDRDAKRTQGRLEAARATTFKQCAQAYIESHKAGWRNAKHAVQWENTLAAYAYPEFGDLPVQSVDTALVQKALAPIWSTKTETASRLRGRIESVLDWARVQGLRTGENPARWRGHLDKLLPKRSKVQRVEHHPALPYAKIPAFMAELRKMEGAGPRALEFTILTGARTGEITGATHAEFDLGAKLWTIPAGRIKAGREHRVPLSDTATAIATKMLELKSGDYLFPGGKRNKPLSNAAMSAVLERMGHTDITVHGFRSTFRDWAAEQTNFPREVAEAALAHTVGNKVEAAYRRGDFFMKRRQLMDAWAKYCASDANNAMRTNGGKNRVAPVLPIRASSHQTGVK